MKWIKDILDDLDDIQPSFVRRVINLLTLLSVFAEGAVIFGMTHGTPTSGWILVPAIVLVGIGFLFNKFAVSTIVFALEDGTIDGLSFDKTNWEGFISTYVLIITVIIAFCNFLQLVVLPTWAVYVLYVVMIAAGITSIIKGREGFSIIMSVSVSILLMLGVIILNLQINNLLVINLTNIGLIPIPKFVYVSGKLMTPSLYASLALSVTSWALSYFSVFLKKG